MGAYLSEPLTEKTSTDESNEKLSFGASSMQGWRVSQEDSHNCILDFDRNASLFAVYDGHGGAEVAKYCEIKMPQFIKDTKAYKEGKFSEALEEAFLNIDATISTPEIIDLLKSLSDNPESTVDPDETIDDKEEVSDLWEEASMPLDKIMAKYQEGQGNPMLNKLKKDGADKPLSPFLRSKRPGSSSGESSGAGSSKMTYNDECEVSSSIKDVEEAKQSESLVSTSNGETKEDGDKISDKVKVDESNPVASQISGSGDSVTPDTSDDSKAPLASSADKSEDKEEHKDKVNGEVSDSASGTKKDATSSSHENGEVQTPSKKGKAIAKTPSSSSNANTPEQSERPKRNRRVAAKLYSMLGLIQSEYDEDDDDSDSNDETFEGKEESSTDEDEDLEEKAVNGVDGDSSEEDVEEEEDTTDEEDIDDEMDAFNMAIKNEPGSNSGCTAVVALLTGSDLYVANAGDSRCVVCREGKAVDMSMDHKPEDEIEFERITLAGGKVSSDGRVNGGLNLSRAIGDLGYKQNKDLGPKEQMITALPDIKTLKIDPNTDEFMILACDGIWNSMTSQEVVDFVKTRLDKGIEKLSQICEEMFDFCLSPNTSGDGTGCDNMTAVIIKFKSSVASKKREKDDVEEDVSQAKRAKTDDNSSVTSSE